jgi:hypothetical protein
MSFINKKLSKKNRKKLYDSIKGRKRITKNVENSNGSELKYFSDVYNLTEKQKEDFIYELRNKFTHNGLAFTNFIADLWILIAQLMLELLIILKYFPQHLLLKKNI